MPNVSGLLVGVKDDILIEKGIWKAVLSVIDMEYLATGKWKAVTRSYLQCVSQKQYPALKLVRIIIFP